MELLSHLKKCNYLVITYKPIYNKSLVLSVDIHISPFY